LRIDQLQPLQIDPNILEPHVKPTWRGLGRAVEPTTCLNGYNRIFNGAMTTKEYNEEELKEMLLRRIQAHERLLQRIKNLRTKQIQAFRGHTADSGDGTAPPKAEGSRN
jgi:hypothetical protein